MDNLQIFFSTSFWGNTGKEFLIALVVFIVALIVLKVFQIFVLARLRNLAKKTKTDIDDLIVAMIGRLRPPFYLAISLYLAIRSLNFPGIIDKTINGLIILILVYYAVLVAQEVITYGTGKMFSRKDEEEADKTAAKTINSLLKMVLWVFAAIMLLSNWGVNVTSLIAGLGIGGIALAFAFQNILEDVFSSFSILIDKPFKVGDFISVGNDSGTVEKVGIKTTRIKTLRGEELVVSNRELTSTRVNNFGVMDNRRVLLIVGVIYDTPAEKLEKIPEIVKKVIEPVKNTTFDRTHFKSFGPSSLDYEIVYYIDSADYAEYMDLQQEVNLGLFKEFEKEEIEFAYPTQTVFVRK